MFREKGAESRLLVAWYERTFNDDYLTLYGPVLAARTEMELAGLRRLCPIEPGARLLDLCCGHGRHCLELAREGYRMVGWDLSELFLKRARAQAGDLPIDFRRGDMRELPFEAEFDGVLSFYNSFGFFKQEAENLRVLEGAFRALRPGGRLFLDLLHPEFMRSHSGRQQVDTEELLVEEEVQYDEVHRRGMIHQWIARRHPPGPKRHYLHALRLYEPDEIRGLLEKAGFKVQAQWGGFEGEPLGPASQRLVSLALR